VRLKVHGEECAAESPAGSRGRAAEGVQAEPREAVGFLALGSNWFHWVSENVTRCATRTSQAYSQVQHYGGRGYPSIFSSVLRKSREWPQRTAPPCGLATGSPPSRLHSGVHIRFIVLNPRYASADVIEIVPITAFNSARSFGK